MKLRSSTAGPVLLLAFTLCFAGLTGCEDQATKQARAKYWQTQQQGLEKANADYELRVERETAEWERAVQVAHAQEDRYESLLTRWEKQADRTDSLLNRWDQVLNSSEERAGRASGQ